MCNCERMISLGFDPELYPAGTHMCFIFNDDDERRQVMAKYVQSGLEGNEQVGYYVDTLAPEDMKKALRELGVNLPAEQDGRQYSFTEAEKVYCPDGRFKIDRMLDVLTQAHHRSIREGYAGARVTGEMTWSRKGIPGSEDLVEYESRINILQRTVPVTAICQYDARCFDGATLYSILTVHPMMIVHGLVVQNPYYIEPEVFLANRAAGSRSQTPDTRPSAEILGSLLVTLQTLDMFPDVEGMAAFLRSALRDIPGITDALACLPRKLLHADPATMPALDFRCPRAGDQPVSAVSCALENQPALKCVPLRTPRQEFGCLLLAVSNEAQFLPYKPFVTNIGGMIASILENRDNVRSLAEANAHLNRLVDELEERVKERTRQIELANESLEARVRTEVAAREVAQMRAAQAERMQALGQLAGGIAHDLNNVLQAVQGATQLIGRRARDNADIQRLVDVVLEAATRGGAVTHRLLAFSRQSDLHAEVIDVAALLECLREILSHSLGAGIEVRVVVEPGLAPIVADKAQLETALVNLATNARDAMAGGGTLTITAEAITSSHADGHPASLAMGHYVCLRMSDTGSGMDQATLARAMEPFFTTKPQGKGTGLGLSMARGFAEQSGGTLLLDSVPGQGTTVSLWLPQADASAVRTQASASPVSGEPGGGQVLLVDDDTLVRSTLEEQLADAGFTVLCASNAAEALACLDVEPSIRVLVSDLSMPGGMDGIALIREAQARHPDLPAVLLTGYAGDGRETDLALGGLQGGRFSLLHKPMSGALLAARITALLAAQETACT